MLNDTIVVMDNLRQDIFMIGTSLKPRYYFIFFLNKALLISTPDQLVEHGTLNLAIVGSNPTLVTHSRTERRTSMAPLVVASFW